MRRLDVVLRWLGAVGITLAPLGLFVLPGLMHPEPYETAEDQFRAIAEGSGGEYLAHWVQIFGSVFLHGGRARESAVARSHEVAGAHSARSA